MLVFWLLTSNTYAIDLWFTKGTNWNVIPKWVSNRANFYYCTYNNWIDIQKCNADSPWALGISGYVIGGYSSDFFVNVYWPTSEQISLKWFGFEYENEGITYYQARYKLAVQYYNTFTIPSRTAYQYTNSIGNKFLFSEILVYDNQFTLYDPNTRYWVSWIGDVRLENMMLVANPWKEEQNVFLIQLQKQKAFSLTVDKNKAWEIWKGNWVNKAFLKNLQFEKSYTLTDWGNSLFPPWFKSGNQGINFIYTEDIETQSMDWWGGTTNNPNWNQWGNSDGSYKERLAEYNQCASYWNNVKTYTLYDRECYRWLLDDPADNRDFDVRLAPWKAIVDWNWEGELDIKTKDPICLKFKSRKPVYMQKYKEKRDEFIKDSQEYWLNPSQTINVAEKCGTRPSLKIKEWTEEKWLLDKIQDGFYRFRDNFNELWGKPIVSSGGQNLYNYDYRKDIEQLKFLREYCQWWTIIDKYLQTEEQYEAMKKSYCERYDKLKKEIERKYANWTWFYNGKSLSWALRDIENWADRDYNVWIWKKFVSLITDSFYSGYNSVDFVVPVCWKDNKNSFFEIFFYLFFFLTVFYLFKIFK